MAIEVSLVPDNMRNDGRQFARIIPKEIIEPAQLCEFMAKGTAQGVTDLTSAMAKQRDATLSFLAEGLPVRTPFGVLSVGVHARPIDRSGRGISSESIVVHLRVDK